MNTVREKKEKFKQTMSPELREEMAEKFMINEYLREDGKVVGALVAFVENDEVAIGLSKCHPRDMHKYSKELALNIAIDRAKEKSEVKIPYARNEERNTRAHLEQVLDFVNVRCEKYFQRNVKGGVQEVVALKKEDGKVQKEKYFSLYNS